MFHILLVDDEAQERDGIRFLIDKYKLPLSVAEAANGRKAAEYMSGHHVDILFTDVKMPYKDGLELAKETYAANPEIKIIIFSAYGEFEYAKKAMEAHAVDYLLKPIELDEFQKIMEKVTGELQNRREKEAREEKNREMSRKRLFYKAFTGGSLTPAEKEQLDACVEAMRGRKILVSIESGCNIFEQQEEVFLKLADTWLGAYEYVNLYPDASMLLLCREGRAFTAGLKEGLEKIKRDVRLLLGADLSVVVGREFESAGEMSRQAEEINLFRRDVFGQWGEITCLSEIVLNSEYYAAEVERIKGFMLEAVEKRDEDLILLYGDRLVDTVLHSHIVSRIYVHHIFYDILAALYRKYGLRDKTGLFGNVELLLSNRDSSLLPVKFREVLREVMKEKVRELEDSGRIAERIREMIEDEYMNDIGLEEIARRVNLAPAYVSYLFKKETGSNLVKYITDRRMEKAREFLEDKELKIVQVGKACGYENQPYFNRLFKNYYGVTPKQYREKAGR